MFTPTIQPNIRSTSPEGNKKSTLFLSVSPIELVKIFTQSCVSLFSTFPFFHLHARTHTHHNWTRNPRKITEPELGANNNNPRGATFGPTGLLDTAPGHSHPDGGQLHVHLGPALPGDASQKHRRLDAADQVGPEAGRRNLRVPDLDPARAQLLCHAERCR